MLYDVKNIESKEERFILARYLYGLGLEEEYGLTDTWYNALKKVIEEEGLLPEYINRTWSDDPCPIQLLKKYRMNDLITELVLTDKTQSIPSLTSEYEIYQALGGSNFKPGRMSRKFDGWNMQSSYIETGEHAIDMSRGRSGSPIVVNDFHKLVPSKLPIDYKETVVMEAILTKRDFEILKSRHPKLDLTSPRASVRTALAHPEDIELLTCIAHGIKSTDNPDETIRCLTEWGFKQPTYLPVNSYEDIAKNMEILAQEDIQSDEPTDGVVYWSADGGLRYAFRVGHWEEGIYASFVEGILESPGCQVISPSIQIHPIQIGDIKQRQVNITNWARICSNRLYLPNAPIAFRYKSGANADFEEGVTARLHSYYHNKFSLYKAQVLEGTLDLKKFL